jgi:hypothetical protein
MYTEYQGQMVVTLSWSGGSAAADADDSGRDFLDRIVDHFWAMVQRATY